MWAVRDPNLNYQTWKCHGIFVGINFLATEPTAGQVRKRWSAGARLTWVDMEAGTSTRLTFERCWLIGIPPGVHASVLWQGQQEDILNDHLCSKPLVQAVPMREWRPWQHPFRIHTNLFRWTLELLSPPTISPSLRMASLKNINKIIQNKLRKKGEAAWELSSSKVYFTPEV